MRDALRATRRWGTLPIVLLVAVALAACKGSNRGAADAGTGVDADAKPAEALPHARCVAPTGGLLLASIRGDDAVEIGDAVQAKDVVVVSVVRSKGGARVGGVALVLPDGQSASIVDVGSTDAPLPLVRDGAPYAVSSACEGKRPSLSCKFSLFAIADGKASLLGSVPHHGDEGVAFDSILGAGGALVAWDEDAANGQSRVKVAPIGDGRSTTRPGTPKDEPKLLAERAVSLDDASAESPRLAPRPGGAWLVWLARRPMEERDGEAAAHALEGPGERAAFQWLELTLLDEHGASVGATRRLTPVNGHVDGFDLAVVAGALYVVYRDAYEAADGVGGRVALVTVRGDAIAEPVILAAEGAGRGAPSLLSAPDGAAWVLYADTTDRARLVSVAADRPSSPVAEPALDEARPLLFAAKDALLSAYPADPKGTLRRIPCPP